VNISFLQMWLKCLMGSEDLLSIVRFVRFVAVPSVIGPRTLLLFGPGSVAGIATAYGLNGPGIESRWV
jgi:hypothetical protein